MNSDLTVQPAEILNAMAQTAPFSNVCDVWAPMYRQITVKALLGGTAGPDAGKIAYASVLLAWKDFLAHYDKGRPIILISHSQGSVMMIQLLQSQVDDNPSLRHRIVVAIIAGGNVTVPDGKEVGVTFQHLPVCTKGSQTSCVIAFSSFPTEPPANSMFGRPGQGISLNYGQAQTTGVHVVCVNPASIGGGTGELASSFPLAAVQPLPAQMLPAPAVNTPWVTYPDMYSASCESTGGATWLQMTHNAPGGRREAPSRGAARSHFRLPPRRHQLVNGQPRQRRTRRGGRLQGLSYRPRRAIQAPVKGAPHAGTRTMPVRLVRLSSKNCLVR